MSAVSPSLGRPVKTFSYIRIPVFRTQIAVTADVKSFTNVCCLSITQPVCQGLYIKSRAGKVFLLLDYPSTSFNLSIYAEVNVVLMRRGTYKPDPSISPIRLMNVQRHSPSLLTSLSGRWLDRLTRVCREDG